MSEPDLTRRCPHACPLRRHARDWAHIRALHMSAQEADAFLDHLAAYDHRANIRARHQHRAARDQARRLDRADALMHELRDLLDNLEAITPPTIAAPTIHVPYLAAPRAA